MDICNKYGILEKQKILLSMMKDTHDYLVKSGIRYSLSGGSLLGAIREKGFIPWDDDVDIMMDRDNYKKFLEIGFNKHGYQLERDLWVYRIRQDNCTKRNSPTIDVFVVDRTPDNVFLRKLKLLLVKIAQGTMHKNVAYRNYSFAYMICLLVTQWLGYCFCEQSKVKFYDYVSQLWRDENSVSVSIYNDLFSLVSVCYDGKLMDDIITKKFEDTEFCVISRFDSYLTSCYGDYMIPPPEEERISIH